jgi:hypothetical protein
VQLREMSEELPEALIHGARYPDSMLGALNA